MTAPEPISTEPQEWPVHYPWLSRDERIDLLAEALRGVTIGDWDLRVVRHLAEENVAVVRALASLIGRARAAGRLPRA